MKPSLHAKTIRAVMQAVCDIYPVTPQQLRGRCRRQPIAEARHMAMHLCLNSAVPIADVATHFNRVPNAVRHALKVSIDHAAVMTAYGLRFVRAKIQASIKS